MNPQRQHPRFALIASAILLIVGLIFAMLYDKHGRQWPAVATFFCWFVALGYFLIWVVYRRRVDRNTDPNPHTDSPQDQGRS